VQAIALPPVFSNGLHFAALTSAAMALCVGLGIALAAAPADAAERLWRMVAAAGVLVLAGWAVPHAFAVPGLTSARGDWMAMPGGLSAALAAGCVALAVAAAGPTKASVRSMLTAGVVLVALAPMAGALLVALGPGPGGGRLVYRVQTPARQTPLGALAAATAALLFASGAIDRLRRRSAPAAPRALGSGAA
jgi:hypothetical protein